VAADLGYAPNPAARSLAGGKVGLIATYVSLPGNAPLAFTEIDYYVDVINAATAAAIERGYALVVAPSTAGAETWSRLPLDGVLVIDPADGDRSLAALRERALALVLIGRDLHGTDDDVVVQNDREAATRAVLDHLAECGARRVGLLTFATYESFTEDAIAEYRAWCARRGQEPMLVTPHADSTAGPSAFRAGAEAFLDAPDRPDAVFCMYEGIAAQLLRMAAERGIDVPGELLVASVSELGDAESTKPPLTALELSEAELGATAAELLMDLVEGNPATSVLDVPTRLVARASTARS
jgi:DNA-binding LacI/PurR family transcriptional regulator